MTLRSFFFLALVLLALCSCGGERTKDTDAQFEYRALYTPTIINTPGEFGLVSTNNIDDDWSLWGHNLWRVVGKNAPEDVYAIVNGQRDTTQYCFSSETLYTLLEEWILDQWGSKGGRFTVAHADNKKVCQCDECKRKGNTETSATPAVAGILVRLARKFPAHQFFMMAYHSTKQAPKDKLPDNVGVMLSTIDIPMRYSFQKSKGYKLFDNMVEEWKQVASLLYVWEYDRNFDDYLTPFPCLLVIQQRLRYFLSKGVKGVFVNGSGYDYSTFDDVQSYVLSRLLIDTTLDVDKLVREFYGKYYPECGALIADYYLTLEHRVRDTNHVLPFYGTIEEMTYACLDTDEFVAFLTKLDSISKAVEGTERQLVNSMLTAMTFTRLLLKPDDGERAKLLLILSDYKKIPNLTNYKETNGPLEDFLKNEGKLPD